MDRFIPCKSYIEDEQDQDLISKTLLNSPDPLLEEDTLTKTEPYLNSPAYQSQLAAALFGNEHALNRRVFTFTPNVTKQQHSLRFSCCKIPTRKINNQPYAILDAVDIIDDYYLNLLDWSYDGLIIIALGNSVYIQNHYTGVIQAVENIVPGSDGYVASVAWCENGEYFAVGTNTGRVLVYDTATLKQLRNMWLHSARVSSLSWNRQILSSGSRDYSIVNTNVSMVQPIINSIKQHEGEVCGLKWSPTGSMLVSGSNDNRAMVWETGQALSMDVQQQPVVEPLMLIDQHNSAVRALAWNPHKPSELATGGGTADRYIRLWNLSTRSAINEIDTGSQVCSIQWSPRHSTELLSSHGYMNNNVVLWHLPSMRQLVDLRRHSARVLHTAVSPDGKCVASVAGDELLCFWNVFEEPSDRCPSALQQTELKSKRGNYFSRNHKRSDPLEKFLTIR